VSDTAVSFEIQISSVMAPFTINPMILFAYQTPKKQY